MLTINLVKKISTVGNQIIISTVIQNKWLIYGKVVSAYSNGGMLIEIKKLFRYCKCIYH